MKSCLQLCHKICTASLGKNILSTCSHTIFQNTYNISSLQHLEDFWQKTSTRAATFTALLGPASPTIKRQVRLPANHLFFTSASWSTALYQQLATTLRADWDHCHHHAFNSWLDQQLPLLHQPSQRTRTWPPRYVWEEQGTTLDSFPTIYIRA